MKKIIPFVLALLLLMTSVAAQTLPHPVYGYVTAGGDIVANAKIQYENLDTNTKKTAYTNDYGFYQFELGNVDPRYMTGDQVKVTLVYCETINYCIKQITLSGGGDEVSWDIIDEDLPDIPDDGGDDGPTIITKYTCPDGSVVERSADCVKTITCEDGSTVTNADDCPKDSDALAIALGILAGLIGIALGVLAKFHWGKGFVGLANYYKKLGDEAKEAGDLETAKKHYARAAKMISTAVTKAKDGSYQ